MNQSLTIFDIDISKISFSAAKTGTVASIGQTYEYHDTLYNKTAAIRFSTPLVKFELMDPNSTKGKPAISVNCEDPKLFEATDTILKAIKEKCLIYRGSKVPAELTGVYVGPTGRKSTFYQIFLDGKFGSTPCEIPSVDENGNIVKSRTGVAQFKRVDIKALHGKLCEGIIEFKLGRCTILPNKTFGHKFQACKIICLRFADRPVNAEANKYLEAMSEESSLDILDMHNQLSGQNSLIHEEKSIEMPSMSEVESINLSNEVLTKAAFANSGYSDELDGHSFKPMTPNRGSPDDLNSELSSQQPSFHMQQMASSASSASASIPQQQQSFQLPGQMRQQPTAAFPQMTQQKPNFQMQQQQSFQPMVTGRPVFTVAESAYQ